MSKRELILETLAKYGDIIEGPNARALSRRFPTVVIPHKCQHRNISKIHAWVYQRYNDTRVLRLEITTPERTHIDVNELNKWVAQHTGTMPFATVRLICPEGNTAKLAVTHTVLVNDVNEESMGEILDGLMFMFNKSFEKLSSMEQRYKEPDIDPDDLDGDEVEEDEVEEEEIDDEDDVVISSSKSRVITNSQEKSSAHSVLQELNQLVGLAPVKQLVYQLAAQQDIARKRAEHGLKAVVPSPHLVFTGNPGTGKTTVARLIGQLYKSLGLLKSGHVVEADRSSLVAAYLGQTALKTREICKQALNGVLFIDEAYSLAVDGRDYGHEAIEALLTFMEDHRGEFVVVVAGYSNRMENFLQSNPGLRSRFDHSLHFPDYTTPELVSMFATLVKENQYVMASGTEKAVTALIDSWERGEGFGNGREVRRLFNHVIGAHAAALASQSVMKTHHLCTIYPQLIPAPCPRADITQVQTSNDHLLVGGYL